MARHSRNAKPRAVIGTPWFIRLGIYTLVALVGLVLTVLGIAQPEQVDSWLGQTGSIAALIGGLLAAVNTGRESDEKPVAVTAPAPAPAPQAVRDTGIGDDLPVFDGPTSGV